MMLPMGDVALLSVSSIFFTGLTAYLYVCVFKLEIIDIYFQKSELIVYFRAHWKYRGLRGRMSRLNVIFLSLIWSRGLSKRGLADLGEINALPRSLKYWVVIPFMGFTMPVLIAVFFDLFID